MMVLQGMCCLLYMYGISADTLCLSLHLAQLDLHPPRLAITSIAASTRWMHPRRQAISSPLTVIHCFSSCAAGKCMSSSCSPMTALLSLCFPQPHDRISSFKAVQPHSPLLCSLSAAASTMPVPLDRFSLLINPLMYLLTVQ